MKINSIRNFVQLTADIATAGQPSVEEFSAVAAAGYRYVINLGMLDHPHAVVDEDRQIASFGLTYIHIPVAFDSPTKEQVRFFCNLMASLKGSKVFVHCIMNFRVSAFIYHYLSKIEKLPDEQSKSVMFDHWVLDPVWEELVSWSSEDIGI